MGELYNPYPKLPKNIRQIGERDQLVRLYLEDYVNTYLKRLYPKGGQDLRVGVLLGLAEEHDGVPYLFVDGALEMEDVTEYGEKVVMTETAWKKTYQTMEEMFPKRIVLGWFLCGAPGTALSPLNYWKQHGQYFPGKNQLMYLNSGLEGEEAVYVTSEDGFYKLRGHCIYYERNQMMQDYMIMRKDARRVESGSGDSVIRDFRQRMEDNRSQVTARRSTIRVLGGVCSALAITVLAGSVVMFNNYEKMKEMEAVIASVLPDGIVFEGEAELPGDELGRLKDRLGLSGDGRAGDEQTKGERMGDKWSESGQEPEGDELWVEEAAGNVYPTVDHETMSDTYPNSGNTGGEGSGKNPASGQAAETMSVIGGNQTAGSDGGSGAAGSGTTGSNAVSSGGSTSGITATSLQVINGKTYYKVQDGETLYGICLKIYGNGSKMEEICRLNNLEDENKIISGQNLILP